MAETGISWCDETWNPFVGCAHVSPACTNCYAQDMAARIVKMARGRGQVSHYEPTLAQVNGKTVWSGTLAQAPEKIRFAPLRPQRHHGRDIFVGSMTDFWHPGAVRAWQVEAFAVAALTPKHRYLFLTKRPFSMRAFITDPRTEKDVWTRASEIAVARNLCFAKMPKVPVGGWPLANVALGVTAEDQTRADERIPELLATPAAWRFVSCEPLLGPVNLNKIDVARSLDTLRGIEHAPHPFDPNMKWPLLTPFEHMQSGYSSPGLDWIIAGGESGPRARPSADGWFRDLRDQCAAAGVAFHFKQWGEWAPARVRLSGEPGLFAFGDYEFDRARMIEVNSYPRQFTMFGARGVLERVGTRRAGHLLDGVEHRDRLPGRATLPSPLAGEGGARSATDEGPTL